jgi:hypothetical protein
MNDPDADLTGQGSAGSPRAPTGDRSADSEQRPRRSRRDREKTAASDPENPRAETETDSQTRPGTEAGSAGEEVGPDSGGGSTETEQPTSVPTNSGKSSRARQRESRRRDKEAARTPVKTLPKEDAAVQPSKGTRVLKLDSAPREFSAGRRAKFRVSMPNHQSGDKFVVKMRMQCGSDGAKWRSYDLKQVGRNQWGRLVLFEDRDRGICKYYFVARPTEDTRTVSGDISLHSKIKPYTVTIR